MSLEYFDPLQPSASCKTHRWKAGKGHTYPSETSVKVNAFPRLRDGWPWSMVASPVRLCQRNIVFARRDIMDWVLVEGEGFKELEAADGELRFG